MRIKTKEQFREAKSRLDSFDNATRKAAIKVGRIPGSETYPLIDENCVRWIRELRYAIADYRVRSWKIEKPGANKYRKLLLDKIRDKARKAWSRTGTTGYYFSGVSDNLESGELELVFYNRRARKNYKASHMVPANWRPERLHGHGMVLSKTLLDETEHGKFYKIEFLPDGHPVDAKTGYAVELGLDKESLHKINKTGWKKTTQTMNCTVMTALMQENM